MSVLTENIPSSTSSLFKKETVTNPSIDYILDKDDEQQEDIACYDSSTSIRSSDIFDNHHNQKNYIATIDPIKPLEKTMYEDTLDDNDKLEDSDLESTQPHSPQQHDPSLNTPPAFTSHYDRMLDQDSDDSHSIYSNGNDYVDNETFHLSQADESTTRLSEHGQDLQHVYGDDAGIPTTINHETNTSSISLSSDDDYADNLSEDGTPTDPGVLNRSDSANTGASTPPLDDIDNKLYVHDRKLTDDATTKYDRLDEHTTTTPAAAAADDDDDYSAVNLSNVDKLPFSKPDDQAVVHDHPTASNSKNSLRLSTVSVSDLNDISLLEEVGTANKHDTTHTAITTPSTTTRASVSSQSSSILKTAMSNITNAVITKTAKTPTPPPSLPPKDRSMKPAAIDTTATITTTTAPSARSSTTTQRFVSGLWSPFKSTPTTTKKVTQEKQQQIQPPSQCALPGFQEALLAQMEQLNSDNGNDPKAQQLLNLKRQTIRQSLVLASSNIPNKDDYDWDFWSAAICDFDQVHKNKDLSRQVQKGIPPSLRGMVWQLLSKSKQVELLASQQYCALLRMSSPYDKMIQRDLARTFPGHDYFKEQDGVGQEGLYNVVRAYSVYDTEVGYCQGLAFIVGPLLLNMPDEEAFCVLISLMSNYGLRGHFTPNMEGLHLRIYQFESLVAEHLPHISRHLQRRGIDSTMFASQWFMTLFAYKFPLDLVFRMYDMIFAQGLEVILKFALALLKRNETHLLQLDFEHLLDFLKNGLFEEYKDDERQLVQDASAWNIPRKQFVQLEKEHKARVTKDEQNAKLVDSLQKQQTALRQQVDQLQNTTTTLQSEHQDVKDQLQDSQDQRQHMLDEQDHLKTGVETLQATMQHIPSTIEATFKDQFDPLCTENAHLTQTNARLEDQLSSMETLLIDIKMKYAQSENERDELSKRLFEMKKVIAQ